MYVHSRLLYAVITLHCVKNANVWCITNALCRITGHLGSGQFGTVEKGILKTNKGPVDVAVKTIGPKISEEDKIKLLQEAAIMGQFKHPNIIHLHGMVAAGKLVSIL